MNKEMLLEMLKDATSNLGKAMEYMAELPTKDKVNAHIEMAKAYALTSIAVALTNQEQAPENAAETKKQKGNKKEPAQTPAQTETPAAEPAQTPAPQADATPVAATEPQAEAPLIQIVSDVFIQFTRPVIENDFDYSTWFMQYVNAVDENGNSVVGANWANQYVTAFTGGRHNSVENLNDDSIMGYINFVIDSINEANKAK